MMDHGRSVLLLCTCLPYNINVRTNGREISLKCLFCLPCLVVLAKGRVVIAVMVDQCQVRATVDVYFFFVFEAPNLLRRCMDNYHENLI